MRFPLWRLSEGPEWQESLDAANPHDEYFDRNLQAAYDVLAYAPYEYSRPFTDHNARLFTTKDRAAGYRLVALIRVIPEKQTVELGWMTLEPF